MSTVVAAVVVLGALSLLNLVLTSGVLRRLREHETRMSAMPGLAGLPADVSALVGAAVPEVDVVDSAGERVDRNRLVGASVGFFAVGCEPCHLQAPEFARLPAGPAEPVAVVTGPAGADRDELLTLIGSGAAVLVGAEARDVAEAFGVVAFPTFLSVGGRGRVDAASTSAAGLAERAGAPTAG